MKELASVPTFCPVKGREPKRWMYWNRGVQVVLTDDGRIDGRVQETVIQWERIKK